MDEDGRLLEALERFGRLVSAHDPALIDEFLDPDSALFAGSDPDELFTAPGEVEAHLERVLALPMAIRFRWDRIEVRRSGPIGWLLAAGEAVIEEEGKPAQRIPYRLSGVLQLQGERWRWRLFHGAAVA